jgi:lipopolysaccharide transport system permease protein
VWVAALAWMAGLALVLNLLVKRSRDQLVDWL